MVEIVGFWTPEYLDTKVRKIAAAGLRHLILVVYRGLGVGDSGRAIESAGAGAVLWFRERPRIDEVLSAAEEVGRRVR